MARFPGFQTCLVLLPHAGEHVRELNEEFSMAEAHGLRNWFLELIRAAKSLDSFEFLARQLRSDDQQFRVRAI